MRVRSIAAVLSVMMAGVAVAQNINAAGATFPEPIYNKWFIEYAKEHPSIHINYQPIGSGGGIRQVSDGTIDFGASDAIMTDEQIASAKVKVTAIPTVLGAVVPIYNIPGINKELNFSGDVIADIYLGKISRWNDARIAKDNPGTNLPDKAILPVYRSDGSGTTLHLHGLLVEGKSRMGQQVGKNSSVKWPVGIGQGKERGCCRHGSPDPWVRSAMLSWFMRLRITSSTAW